MTEVLSEQIFSFIENQLLSPYILGSYYRRLQRNKNMAYQSFINEMTDISLLKDAVYDRVMILESSSKSVFLRKFIDILSEYSDEDIKSSVGVEILKFKGVKPTFDRPFESMAYSMMNDTYKLSFYDLENLDFDFFEEQKKLTEPYLARFRKFKDFLLEYSKDFTAKTTVDRATKKIISNKVFVVHGHNDGLKYEVAQTLNKLGVTPIILHEQINENKTIIEKIETNSDVKYAIVLLTDDDVGKGKFEKELKPRARQNVIFEMGYFIGLLGRQNVCCLVNNHNLERPNDISGIVYLNYHSNWVLDLAKELQNAGVNIDMNNLI